MSWKSRDFRAQPGQIGEPIERKVMTHLPRHTHTHTHFWVHANKFKIFSEYWRCMFSSSRSLGPATSSTKATGFEAGQRVLSGGRQRHQAQLPVPAVLGPVGVGSKAEDVGWCWAKGRGGRCMLLGFGALSQAYPALPQVGS